jgi:hypothetical protein
MRYCDIIDVGSYCMIDGEYFTDEIYSYAGELLYSGYHGKDCFHCIKF